MIMSPPPPGLKSKLTAGYLSLYFFGCLVMVSDYSSQPPDPKHSVAFFILIYSFLYLAVSTGQVAPSAISAVILGAYN